MIRTCGINHSLSTHLYFHVHSLNVCVSHGYHHPLRSFFNSGINKDCRLMNLRRRMAIVVDFMWNVAELCEKVCILWPTDSEILYCMLVLDVWVVKNDYHRHLSISFWSFCFSGGWCNETVCFSVSLTHDTQYGTTMYQVIAHCCLHTFFAVLLFLPSDCRLL